MKRTYDVVNECEDYNWITVLREDGSFLRSDLTYKGERIGRLLPSKSSHAFELCAGANMFPYILDQLERIWQTTADSAARDEILALLGCVRSRER